MKRDTASYTLARATRAVGVASALAVGAIVAGCSSTAGDDAAGATGSSGDSQDELRGGSTCGRYAAFFLDESCPVVSGRGGAWKPSQLFDAPASVTEKSCAYQWIPSASAKPDTKALILATHRNGAPVGSIAPACGEANGPVDVAPHEVPVPPILPQLGSVGCDVCGIITGGRGFVVVPPNVTNPSFPVDLSNGQVRQFALPAHVSGALEINLPPPPAGTEYRDGAISAH